MSRWEVLDLESEKKIMSLVKRQKGWRCFVWRKNHSAWKKYERDKSTKKWNPPAGYGALEEVDHLLSMLLGAVVEINSVWERSIKLSSSALRTDNVHVGIFFFIIAEDVWHTGNTQSCYSGKEIFQLLQATQKRAWNKATKKQQPFNLEPSILSGWLSVTQDKRTHT